jgi:hypothetical protein
MMIVTSDYSTLPRPTGRRALCKTGESQEYFRSNWRVLGNSAAELEAVITFTSNTKEIAFHANKL